MPTGQQYATNVPQTTITSLINASATSMSVASSSGWPTSFPFTAILEIGTSLQEPIDVTNIVGTTWTITRAIDGTTGFTHQVNATVTHGDIGRDFREARAHIDASSSNDSTGHAVHGLASSSSVVGTTDTQTLTNKTLTSPVIGTIVNTGTLTLPTSTDTLVGRATTDTLTNKTISAATFTGAQTMGAGAWTGTGAFSESNISATGIVGANANTVRLAGATSSGPPVSGTFNTGDVVYDLVGNAWFCVGSGSPGTWVSVGDESLVSETTLGSPAANISVTIPSWAKSLRCEWTARGAAAGTTNTMIQFNGDTGSNYLWQEVQVENAVVTGANSGGTTTFIQIGVAPGSGATANYFGCGDFVVPAPAGATFKTAVGKSFAQAASNDSFVGTYGGQWNNTAVITSMVFKLASGNLATGSSLIVYAGT